MIMRKVCVKKRFDENFLKTSNQKSDIWMKVRVNERKPSKGTYKSVREIEKFEFSRVFLLKLLCDDQGSGVFVRVLETFELETFSSIRVIESVRYIYAIEVVRKIDFVG